MVHLRNKAVSQLIVLLKEYATICDLNLVGMGEQRRKTLRNLTNTLKSKLVEATTNDTNSKTKPKI